jgi:IS30 family transposase
VTSIHQRPAHVTDRLEPGHWEGDSIMGPGNRSAIVTLIERRTRTVRLVHLGADRSAAAVRDGLIEVFSTMPPSMRRTLTWDRGTEMSQHLQMAAATGLAVYFCDPHSPWQRGSNENTNGLLRGYFPKGTDLSPARDRPSP